MYVADGIANDRIFGLKSMKSILLAVLMISMSLSVGLVELNKSPWLVEDAESELEDINKPMHTTAPSISYSPSTLSLVNNTAMTPTTPTNAGGNFTVGVAANIGTASGFDMYETFTSMGIDSNDDVHFSYHISSMYGKDLGYSTNSGGSWANTTIDSTGDVGMHTSLAIDSNDVVHISYTDMTNSDLKYATCSSSCTSSTSWTNTTVDTAGGEDTSIAIDSNNDVHISYYDDDNDELKYATCSSSCSSSSSWTTTSVDTSGIGDNSDTQDRTSIAIDSNDELHVSYGDKTNSKLKYATCSSSCSSSSSWSSTTLISTSANTPNNMAIDSNDNLHISFKSTGLRYASCSSSCSTASSWTFITIDTGTQAGSYNSIALDSNDGVHISYQSDYSFSPPFLSADLKYATCASSCSAASSWYNHTIDSSVPVNYEAIGLSMGIDSDNKSHIIYQRVYNSSWEIAYTGTGSNGYSVSPDLPSGLILNWVNGTISGTPTSFSSSTTYTITAKNAYGSTTTTLTISVNTPPLITYDLGTGGTVYIVQNTPMSSLSPTLTTGFSAPTSCSHTGLPSGLLLSSTCVLSGTPTTLGSTTLTITPSNIAGTGTATSFIVNVNASGGSIIINTTSTEANLGIAISNITMSYTHTASVQNWTSGVTNSTINPAASIPNGGSSKSSINSGQNGDIAAVYSVKQTGATSANLTLLYKWNGAWTESTLDSSVDTDVASVAIDRQGALHIGYVDKDNAKLKYVTNATGSWVIETLGDAATDQSAHTAISVHPVTNAVHIMAVNGSNSNAGVKHYTNETGTWLDSTISDPLEDEGYGVKADLDFDGNLHVIFRREANSVGNPAYDHLILASRINGVWQNQTITECASIGWANNPDMAIDSQGQIHVAYNGKLNQGKTLYHGVLTSVNPSSSLVSTQIDLIGLYPALAIDSNDNLHLSYHTAGSAKNQNYTTNTSGSWNTPIETSATAGGIHGSYFAEMTTDSNDDVFILAFGEVVSSCKSCDIRLTRIQGLGPSLAINPIFEVSPPLPDGLNMNWHNGTISGTPTETHANTTHTVTVTAFGATTTETFTLMVIEAPDISYGQSSYTFTKNSLVSGVTPTNVGGAPDSWGI
ncbi:Ig domain-containing protein, partial [Candidatus Poseidoniales archaeon]|nr:Ig domain-containing protein [Candidatus Poseidoniales archaeon]MDA8778018.1 Ig domain-containing protein [Candidatus Poseidoniales archaeon]